jgi:hypothetical protein
MERIEIGTFYYQLDCSWLNDPKIQIMINELGTISIGVYVSILSWLYLEKGVLTTSYYKHIAKQISCDEGLVKNVVENFHLFYFEDVEFSSKRARDDMEKRLKMSKGGKTSKKKF